MIQAANLSDKLIANRPRVLELLPDALLLGQQVLDDGTQGEFKGQQGVTKLIVQVRSQAPAFILPGGEQRFYEITEPFSDIFRAPSTAGAP
jgi:hypothetical protein